MSFSAFFLALSFLNIGGILRHFNADNMQVTYLCMFGG
jgi:hypothetical protein